MGKTLISTVTPVYSGAEYLEDLVRELDKLRKQWDEDDCPFGLAEAIFVDDASIDNSAERLKDLAGSYPWVRVVTLSRNWGQHPATIAGILHSSGDWVFTLDEDLQHHPKHMFSMIRKGGNGIPGPGLRQPYRACTPVLVQRLFFEDI